MCLEDPPRNLMVRMSTKLRLKILFFELPGRSSVANIDVTNPVFILYDFSKLKSPFLRLKGHLP